MELIGKLRSLLFPGYFDNSSASELLQATQALLNKIICSPEIADKFLEKLPGIRTSIATDVEAAFDGDPAAVDKEEIIIAYPGLYAISVYRLAHELHILKVPMLPRAMTEQAHSITGIDIHPGAQIGDFFFIDHGTG
jgi:serine O-acetyltransferase